MRLRPKNVLIIGGATGIGLATVKKLLEAEVKRVVLASRNVKKNAVEFSDSRILTLTLDITEVQSQEKIIKEIDDLCDGQLDGCVISSGINYNGADWRGFNISEADYDRVMDTNLKGVFFWIRNLSNYWHSMNRKGNICVVSSISAHRDLLSVYQISKNAISGIVHAYGKHLYERGIILNAVEPGTTEGGMLGDLAKYTDGVRRGLPWPDNAIHRVIRPEEIADVIMFLLSNAGEILCGSCVLAGGGCKSISR